MTQYPEAYTDYLCYFHGARDYFECHEVMEEYWKEHPNVLPYEECRLMKADGSRLEGLRMNLGFGQVHYKDGLSIFCFSKTLKVGFQIPVHIHPLTLFFYQ